MILDAKLDGTTSTESSQYLVLDPSIPEQRQLIFAYARLGIPMEYDLADTWTPSILPDQPLEKMKDTIVASRYRVVCK